MLQINTSASVLEYYNLLIHIIEHLLEHIIQIHNFLKCEINKANRVLWSALENCTPERSRVLQESSGSTLEMGESLRPFRALDPLQSTPELLGGLLM